jgi:hypothetical protein
VFAQDSGQCTRAHQGPPLQGKDLGGEEDLQIQLDALSVGVVAKQPPGLQPRMPTAVTYTLHPRLSDTACSRHTRGQLPARPVFQRPTKQVAARAGPHVKPTVAIDMLYNQPRTARGRALVQAGQAKAEAVVTAPVHVEASASSEPQQATTAAQPKVDEDEGVVLHRGTCAPAAQGHGLRATRADSTGGAYIWAHNKDRFV